MKRKLLIIVLTVIVLSSCASNPDLTECVTNDPYGFWAGLWHGIILFFSFIGSWFSESIVIYSANNNGFWYDLGFMIGGTGFVNGFLALIKFIFAILVSVLEWQN